MSAQTTEELLIEIFSLTGKPADEIESMVQRLIKIHDLKDDDNDKSKIFAKMVGQIPKVFPKQTSTYSSIANYYDHLVNDDQYNVVKFQQDPLSPPNHPQLSPPLHADIVAKLTQQGRQQLYSHQVRSIDLIRQGKNVLITTPTASGKSYGYVLPFLEAVKADPQANGLFIFPMNALTNDQYDKLVEFEIGTVAKYDGSVKSHQKKMIRDNPPNALLTNPDQIHHSILRTYSEWTDFFKNLKFIVIDEIHHYKGFFGSNVSNILFRLREAVKKAGGTPQIICTSATIKNAKYFAKELAWVDFEEVNSSGSGRPEKYYVMLDSVNTQGLKIGDSQEEWVADILEQLQKKSPQSLLYDLVMSLGDNGFQSMVFVNSRLQADLFRDAAQYLSGKYSGLKPETICSYHAGMSNAERQKIEQAIKNGSKRIIFTTSALELGIDIGSLDACVLYGLPKTSNEIWQRIGRVGRDPSKAALAIIVNSYSADDIYYFFKPEKFFATKNSPEEPIIYPYNEALRKLHMQCGHYEGLLKQDIDDKHLWTSIDTKMKLESAYPRIPIRNSWYDPFTLFDEQGLELGTLEYERVYRELHPGAIHRAESSNYKMKNLDFKAKTAHLKEVKDLTYYTVPDVETVIDIGANPIEEILNYGNFPLLIGRGDLEVNLSVDGYWRIPHDGGFPRRSNLQNNSERKFTTKGFWLTIPPGKAKLWDSIISGFSGEHSFSILHSLEHLLMRQIVEKGYCDTSDVMSLTFKEHYNYMGHTIFIYDNYHKGMGISEQIFLNIERLISSAYARISTCPCEDGCPACIIKNSFCEHQELDTDKSRTIEFLKSIAWQQPTKSKYISRKDSLRDFSAHSRTKFNVGDVYKAGWKVVEKADDEYILENVDGGIAYVPYEDSPL
ncbi:MAG: DEAD/DEAH box helicase [Calditrichaeota bacterium]|jgi:DEAD/DEAH box helicase domain-containing protein|nr:DEAD/DEAH box helicase [Calditrichota bacterium]